MAEIRSESENGSTYNIRVINRSNNSWYFFIFQRPAQPDPGLFSTAWLSSPYRVGYSGQYKFSWQVDYSFVWGTVGAIAPGVIFLENGSVPAQLNGKNKSTFSIKDQQGSLSPAGPGGKADSLVLDIADNVPQMVYATGVAMAGKSTILQQARPNLSQIYPSDTAYFIGAAMSIREGRVLEDQVSLCAQLNFPPNVNSLVATLEAADIWTVRPDQ